MEQKGTEEGIAEAAKAIGLSVGGLVASLLGALPVLARSFSSAQGEPYNKLADWADKTSRAIVEVLVREFPPEEVARLAEDIARSARGLALIADEVLKAIGDPQIAEVVKRTIEGFRKGLQALTSPNVSDLIRALSDQDVAYALSVMLTLLKALGIAMRSAGATAAAQDKAAQ